MEHENKPEAGRNERHSPRRYIALSSPNKAIRVVRFLQKDEHWSKKTLKFFITLTFSREHLVQNNKFKGLTRVVQMLKNYGAGLILIKREETKKGDTHFHIASNIGLSIKKLRTAWVHGYVHETPIIDSNKVINYLLKGMTIDSNRFKVIVKSSWLYFMPEAFK